jgi:hypothetical protein
MKSVMIAQTAVIRSEISRTSEMTPASSPMRSMLADAFRSLAGEMTLANPPRCRLRQR